MKKAIKHMIIKKSDLSPEAYRNILIENILRNADAFNGEMEREIERADRKVMSGEWSLLYSQTKQTVNLIETQLLKK